MNFAPGEVLLRRLWRGDQITHLNVCRVAADDEHGLRLWLPSGSPHWRVAGADGRTHHDAPVDELVEPRLVRSVWKLSDHMIWMPTGAPYAIWWRWTDGDFTGWYVNLEDPYVRWADRGCAGVDSADHVLDLLVQPDHSWRWKDEEEFEARTGHPLYWPEARGRQIRATGERLARQAEAAEYPFNGVWTGFRPDAAWTMPPLPPGYDRPRVLA